MRIKLDENLPVDLSHFFEIQGHDVHTVYQEELSGIDDATLFETVQNEKRLLVTQDLDFSDLRRYSPGKHFGIVLLRLRNPSRFAMVERLQSVMRIYDLEDWSGCFVVISDQKLRIRRPS